MDQNDKADLERFRDTERKRERERQIRYQESLGPVKTARELEIERLDRLEEIWKGTTRGY
jgi:hypothetical protein